VSFPRTQQKMQSHSHRQLRRSTDDSPRGLMFSGFHRTMMLGFLTLLENIENLKRRIKNAPFKNTLK
jgi:hypothetical protein